MASRNNIVYANSTSTNSSHTPASKTLTKSSTWASKPEQAFSLMKMVQHLTTKNTPPYKTFL